MTLDGVVIWCEGCSVMVRHREVAAGSHAAVCAAARLMASGENVVLIAGNNCYAFDTEGLLDAERKFAALL